MDIVRTEERWSSVSTCWRVLFFLHSLRRRRRRRKTSAARRWWGKNLERKEARNQHKIQRSAQKRLEALEQNKVGGDDAYLVKAPKSSILFCFSLAPETSGFHRSTIREAQGACEHGRGMLPGQHLEQSIRSHSHSWLQKQLPRFSSFSSSFSSSHYKPCLVDILFVRPDAEKLMQLCFCCCHILEVLEQTSFVWNSLLFVANFFLCANKLCVEFSSLWRIFLVCKQALGMRFKIVEKIAAAELEGRIWLFG